VIIYAFKKQIKWKKVVLLWLSGIAGAALGVWLSGHIGGELVGKIFGGLLIAAGLYQVLVALKKKKSGA
jgi:uncharacterized membrane protein YfcA